MYSIRSLFDAIWSTPCGHYFLPYGVLHIIAIPVNFGRNGKALRRGLFLLLAYVRMHKYGGLPYFRVRKNE